MPTFGNRRLDRAMAGSLFSPTKSSPSSLANADTLLAVWSPPSIMNVPASSVVRPTRNVSLAHDTDSPLAISRFTALMLAFAE